MYLSLSVLISLPVPKIKTNEATLCFLPFLLFLVCIFNCQELLLAFMDILFLQTKKFALFLSNHMFIDFIHS